MTLLRAAEVEARYGIASPRLLRWVREGRLRAVRTPGGAYRYRPEAVEAAVASVRRGRPPKAPA